MIREVQRFEVVVDGFDYLVVRDTHGDTWFYDGEGRQVASVRSGEYPEPLESFVDDVIRDVTSGAVRGGR